MTATLPKVIYRVKAIPSKIPRALFAKLMEIYPKKPREMQGTQNSQNNLGKNKIGRVIFPEFKTYYKTTAINIVW